MRQKLITLCPVTWDYAIKKKNFSAWVRDKLREERNKSESKERYCRYCGLWHPKEGFFDHECEGFR